MFGGHPSSEHVLRESSLAEQTNSCQRMATYFQQASVCVPHILSCFLHELIKQPVLRLFRWCGTLASRCLNVTTIGGLLATTVTLLWRRLAA